MGRHEDVLPIQTIPLSTAKLCVSCELIHEKDSCPACLNTQNLSLASILKEAMFPKYTPKVQPAVEKTE